MITTTIPEADAYHAGRLHNATWINANETDVKAPALIWAARLIDERFQWIENYEDLTNPPVIEVPIQIKNAIAEFAYQLTFSDPTLVSNEQKYTHMEMDGMIVKVNPVYAKTNYIIPDVVMEMLYLYCNKKKKPGSYGGRRLERC